MAADGTVKIDVDLNQKELASKLKTLGKTVTAAIGVASAAAAAALKPIVDLGMSFEKAISGIKAVSGATVEEMAALEQAALQAGADTVFSASEAATAIEELVKAGLNVEQALGGGLAGALNLAAAGEIGLAEAAEIASTVLNAFRDDGLSVADAADILAGAANASATDVGELKYSLSMVSTVASGVGMSFEDTSTALAVFAQNGLKGSDAGTSLKTMLSRLVPMTDAQTAAMDSLGLITEEGTSVFYDQNGSLKSLADVSDILQNSLAGLTDEQRQSALYTIFGSDAIRGATVLFREGADGVNDMADAIKKISAQDVAAARLDNLAGDVEYLTGSLETLAIRCTTTMSTKSPMWMSRSPCPWMCSERVKASSCIRSWNRSPMRRS